jgi:hypothetical protein
MDVPLRFDAQVTPPGEAVQGQLGLQPREWRDFRKNPCSLVAAGSWKSLECGHLAIGCDESTPSRFGELRL